MKKNSRKNRAAEAEIAKAETLIEDILLRAHGGQEPPQDDDAHVDSVVDDLQGVCVLC